MHYCGIIIKDKRTDIPTARRCLGELLLEKNLCDWYSVDDYRERTFKGKKVIPLAEFKEVFKEWLDDYKPINATDEYLSFSPYPFCVLDADEDGYCEPTIVLLPLETYAFYDYKEEYAELLNVYMKLYKKATMDAIDELLKSNKDYDVCLLDYHD